jgi:pilus assembly protein FimV
VIHFTEFGELFVPAHRRRIQGSGALGKSMTMKSRVLFGLLFAVPMAAHAVGLGDIHLGSSLNQPLSADIELLGATTEELTQLRAGVASREIFARYGIDRPSFVGGLTFKVAKDVAGRNVISVHSSDAISEPFVTFLLELSWPRGHLIREYTVLLDPPVFESTPSTAPAMAAPISGSASPAAGTIDRTPPVTRPVAAPENPSAPAARAPAPAPATGGEYTVARNDALSVIIRRQGVSAPADVNRLMIATFRANPAAFDGNINRLRRGAVLRIPPESEWATSDAHEAAAEVNRQVEAWHAAGGGASHGGGEARLRLVVPKEPVAAPKDAAPAPAPVKAPAPLPPARNPALDKELADARRLLELKNAEMARMQAQAKAVPKPAPAPAPVPVKQPEVAPPAPAPVADAKPADAKPAEPVAKQPAAPVVAEPGFLDILSDNAGYLGAGLGAIVVLLAGLFGFKAWRRRRDAASDLDSVLAPQTEMGMDSESFSDTQSMKAQRHSIGSNDAIVVEEAPDSGEYTAPPFASHETQTMLRPPKLPTPPVDSRLTSESSIGLDQADPLAEADFHMAYGLYDQAADIVRAAIEREPGRRDLQMKLLEVYFVWGNKDAFIDVARTLARGRDESPASEWDKVAIMGRQIAPEDPLFADRGHATSGADMDLDLDAGGTQGVDLELLGDAGHASHTDDGIDLDLGRALAGGDPSSETGESPTIDPERFDLLLEPEHAPESGAVTQEMPLRGDAPTIEQPMLARSAFEDSPTVEMPAYVGNSTLIEKLDLATRQLPQMEATAEISIDELGLDTGTLGGTATANALSALDNLHDMDNPTLDPIDAQSLLDGDPGTHSLLDDNSGERTRIQPGPTFGDAAATQLAPRISDAATTELLPSIDGEESAEIELSSSELDLDLDELARALENDTAAMPRRDEMRFSTDVFATGIHKAPATGMDLDVGSPLNDLRDPTVTERMPQDLDLPELEPVTLSEVGTKLDLARAYMDMGDPDGARSILQEVLSEGSASQKVEAQRLIETLPR